MALPGGWELVLLIGVLVLLFGWKKLPDMARSIGQSARVFKGEMKGLKDEEPRTKPAEKPAEKPTALPPAPPVPPVPPADAQKPTEPVRRDAER
jgi:sec-independent protein translocase protein TatA